MVSARRPGVVDAGDRGQDLGRDLLVQLDVLVELLRHRAAQRLDLGRGVGRRRHRRAPRPTKCSPLSAMRRGVGALHAFDQHLHGAVGQLEHLQDARDAADVEHVVGLGLVLAGGLLRHQHDLAARFHRGFERLDGLRAAHEQRDDHVREHHHVAQRQQRQRDRFGGRTGCPDIGNLSFSGRHEARDWNCKMRASGAAGSGCQVVRRWPWPARGRPAAAWRLLRWCARRPRPWPRRRAWAGRTWCRSATAP